MADELWVPDRYRREALGDPPWEMSRALAAFGSSPEAAASPNADIIAEMRKNRRVNERLLGRTAGVGGPASGLSGFGGGITQATPRPRDPMFYWRQNNWPFDTSQAEHLQAMRMWCRLLYLSHPVVGACIDIYSRFPLVGMELVGKDESLVNFYTDLFMDNLDYTRYGRRVLREYFLVSEAFPFGSFNELLGVWEDDSLLNPDDIEVIQSPFSREPRFEMRLPAPLRKILKERRPEWEYQKLIRAYPELQHFVHDNARMPVSNVLLRQLRFDADTFNPRGVPLLMRGFRTLMQEEMLNSAQDAISDRLSTPLILVKLGASATDLGTQSPWIPNEGDLMAFEARLDAALSADFRVLTHHFAVEMDSVFGKETMPDFGPEFERLEARLLQVFGLSKTMISGADRGETYAADAMNRDLVSQLLTDAQELWVQHYKARAYIVAEAQQHYDYEVRGGRRYPIMEEVLEIDEETGESRVVEQPKLLIPEMKCKASTMQSDAEFRELVEALVAAGVPISDKTRLVNIPIDLTEEYETKMKEEVDQAVRAQEVRRDLYQRLVAEGLPIDEELKRDFEPRPLGQDPPARPAEELPPAGLGVVAPDHAALAPTEEDILALQAEQQPGGAGDGIARALPANVVPFPPSPAVPPQRPPESDEMRRGMPRPAGLSRLASLDGVPFEPVQYVDHHDQDRELAGPLISGPRHVGSRRGVTSQQAEDILNEGLEEDTA